MSDGNPNIDVTKLTHQLEAHFHARHREQLPPLVRLADMIEDLHDGDLGVPKGLFTILRRMSASMEAQMKKEELALFPAILQDGDGQTAEEIAAARAYHAVWRREADEIRGLTDDLTLPRGACEPWATLYSGLADFLADLEEHRRLEIDVLFPKVEGVAEDSRCNSLA